VAYRCSKRWDAFRINTTNRVNSLPGSPYAAPEPDGFDTAVGWAEYLGRYSVEHELPVRTGVSLEAATRVDGGGFEVDTSDGELSSRCVVAATGSLLAPEIPELASALSIAGAISVTGRSRPDDGT
jgi:putative flavoprotein involved in K+ transport